MYGPVVTYAEDEHAHVQTEFAFDINEIAHGRLAPPRYLQRVGLQVPVAQLAAAFYDTYGLGEPFSKTRRRRTNVKGYRFAVRSFIPRIAYALTILHRGDMPPDSQSPEFEKMANEASRVGNENGWQEYRRKPGFLTYSLAGLIFILPKFGPVRLVVDQRADRGHGRGLCAQRESLDGCAALGVDGVRRAETRAGEPRSGYWIYRSSRAVYRLTDETYASLLHRLTSDPRAAIPAGVKADVLGYYADPDVPTYAKMYPNDGPRIQADLRILKAMPVKARRRRNQTGKRSLISH